MVLAVLALLTLMAILLTYTARLETSSARNAGIAVQNRVSALTGIDFIGTDMVISGIGTPFLEEGFEPFSDRTTSALSSALPNQGLPTRDLTVGSVDNGRSVDRRSSNDSRPFYTPGRATTRLATAFVTDASARININAADETVLENFFDQLAAGTGGSFSGAQVAQAIVKTRLGGDNAPGNARNDDSGAGRDAIKLLTSGRVGTQAFGSSESDASQRLARETLRERTRETARIRDLDERAQRQRIREAMLTGIDTPEDFVADIRRPGFGDDVRFTTVGDLLAYPAIRSTGLTAEDLQRALPYLTTFSVSLDRQPIQAADKEPRALLDLNRASAEEIFESLLALYGGSKNERLLKQFAVNIVDARDFDSTPTVFPGTETAYPVIGVERTPFITEVYPQTPAPEEQGHGGQFVELYNPWPEPIEVNGWQLRGAGISVGLTGTIAPKGYLIVTNDTDNRTDPFADQELPGTGSLYDLFGVVANTGSQKVLERRNLQLDRRSPRVELRLVDSAGDLIDYFVYYPRREATNGTTSYQRSNPLVQVAKRLRPTPFAQAPGSFSDTEAVARLAAYPPDGPLVCVTDLMDVFAGFVDAEAGEMEMWAFPAVSTPRSTAEAGRNASVAHVPEDANRIDARVMDLFATEFRARPAGIRKDRERLPEEIIFARDNGAGRVRSLGESERSDVIHASLHAQSWIYPVGHKVGRVNLNTADPTVLSALPGIDREAAVRVWRERVVAQNESLSVSGARALNSPLPPDRWAGPSDVLVDLTLWGTSLSEADRLDRLRALLPHVTFSTRSFVLRSQALTPQSAGPESPDASAGVALEAIVATDRGTSEMISLRRVVEVVGEVDTVRELRDTSTRVNDETQRTAIAR